MEGNVFIIVVLKKVPMYACKVASIISQDIVRWHSASGDKEHGCIYGWMNGTNSDNAISIQTMVTRTMATQKMVGRNMVGRNLVTPNMVTPKLIGTRLRRW